MELNIYNFALIPVIIALVELVKTLGLPAKLAPLAALILGIVAGLIYLAQGDFKQAIFLGIVAGLSASGLYSSSKNVSQYIKSSSNLIN